MKKIRLVHIAYIIHTSDYTTSKITHTDSLIDYDTKLEMVSLLNGNDYIATHGDNGHESFTKCSINMHCDLVVDLFSFKEG